jgi:hypothetical protein
MDDETTHSLLSAYFFEVVRPLLDQRWPDLALAAGRIGSGSDALGFDDEISRDHDWGLRLSVLVEQPACEAVQQYLEATVPLTFRGLPTRFPTSWAREGMLGVEVRTVEDFVVGHLGVDARRELDIAQWLSLTGQSVLEVTAGPLFEDRSGELTKVRQRLEWYPDDVWLYVLAAGWLRVEEEFPFLGRTGARGDDLGSRLIGARIAGALMHLGFLLDRAWPPYSKWLGTAFARLPSAADLSAPLDAALRATRWEEREAALAEAVSALVRRQAEMGLATPERAIVPFYDRPFLTTGLVADSLRNEIKGEGLRARRLVGSVQQWVDSIPALLSPEWRMRGTTSWDGI